MLLHAFFFWQIWHFFLIIFIYSPPTVSRSKCKPIPWFLPFRFCKIFLCFLTYLMHAYTRVFLFYYFIIIIIFPYTHRGFVLSHRYTNSVYIGCACNDHHRHPQINLCSKTEKWRPISPCVNKLLPWGNLSSMRFILISFLL